MDSREAAPAPKDGEAWTRLSDLLFSVSCSLGPIFIFNSAEKQKTRKPPVDQKHAMNSGNAKTIVRTLKKKDGVF